MKLIDKTELLKTLEKDIDLSITGTENMKQVKRVLQTILDDVKESPEIDDVHVIRCKDCKHCMIFSIYETKWYVCARNDDGIDVNADDYCSKAERKEE